MTNNKPKGFGNELPVITNKQGDIVPYVSIKESGIINAYWMPYQLFALLDELFCQRDTEGRWNKAKKYLSKFIQKIICKMNCITCTSTIPTDHELPLFSPYT